MATAVATQAKKLSCSPHYSTITLSYDAADKSAERTLEYILAMGFFEVQPPLSKLERSLQEYRSGKTSKIKNPESIIEECLS